MRGLAAPTIVSYTALNLALGCLLLDQLDMPGENREKSQEAEHLVWTYFIPILVKTLAKSADPDQMPQNAASDQGLQNLL